MNYQISRLCEQNINISSYCINIKYSVKLNKLEGLRQEVIFYVLADTMMSRKKTFFGQLATQKFFFLKTFQKRLPAHPGFFKQMKGFFLEFFLSFFWSFFLEKKMFVLFFEGSSKIKLSSVKVVNNDTFQRLTLQKTACLNKFF